ncbi:MAG: hypothetical protein ABI051_07560 [Vicinamibacterales bacterium]
MKATIALGLASVMSVFVLAQTPRSEPRPPATAAARQSAETARQQALEIERLRLYQVHLVTVVKPLPVLVSVANLIRPMMQLADERSSRNGSADLENRAALFILAFYLYGHGPAVLIPEARDWPQPDGRNVTLLGRDDLAKHFTISAAISAAAGMPLAVWIGLYKEVDDARSGGSGFSFVDLTADRAGTMFGQLAGATPASARKLHTRLRLGLVEADMMPSVATLPEALSSAELERRFGGTKGAAYEQLVAEIDRRVASAPLFQTP